MNKIILMGRLARDPEVRRNGDKVVANYTLVTDRRFKQEGKPEADFHRCVCWGKTAEFAEKYLHKGIKILVTGRIEYDSYTNKDGAKVNTTDIVVEEHEFCESKKEGQTDEPIKPTDFMKIPDDIEEELPFA